MELLSVNPVFLFLIFAIGYVYGLLTVNLSGWKMLAIGFTAIFIYQPILDAGIAAAVVFVVGVLCHHFGGLIELYFDLREVVASNQRSNFSSQRLDEDETPSDSQFNNADEAYEDLKDFFKQEKKSEDPGAQRQGSKKTRKQNSEKSGPRQNSRSSSTSEAERLRRENEKLRREASEARKQADEESIDRRSPLEILGLQDGFTAEELKRAYRMKVQQWHSDQLSGRAPELIKLAEEEMKKINAAFDQLKKKSK